MNQVNTSMILALILFADPCWAQPVRILSQQVKCYAVQDNTGRHSRCEVRQAGSMVERMLEIDRFRHLEEEAEQLLAAPLQPEDFEDSMRFEEPVRVQESMHFEEPMALAPQDLQEVFDLPEEPDNQWIPRPWPLLAVVQPQRSAHPTPSNDDPLENLETLEKSVVYLLNQARSSLGLTALAPSALASTVAEAHSRDMCQRRFFAHQAPEGTQPWDRLRVAGGKFKMAAENIASGYTTAEEVHQGWMNSPGHQKNRLNPDYTHVGVGLYVCEDGRAYWTELFYR